MARSKKADKRLQRLADGASEVDPEGGRHQTIRRSQHRREASVSGTTANIDISPDKLAAFCRRWQVKEVALFGSVLRDDFGPDSDVDVLVQFEEEARHTLFDLDDMELELQEIFRREVDLVSRRGIEGSSNYLRRNSILASAQVIYGS